MTWLTIILIFTAFMLAVAVVVTWPARLRLKAAKAYAVEVALLEKWQVVVDLQHKGRPKRKRLIDGDLSWFDDLQCKERNVTDMGRFMGSERPKMAPTPEDMHWIELGIGYNPLESVPYKDKQS